MRFILKKQYLRSYNFVTFFLDEKSNQKNQEIPQAIRTHTHHTPAVISGLHLLILAFFFLF